MLSKPEVIKYYSKRNRMNHIQEPTQSTNTSQNYSKITSYNRLKDISKTKTNSQKIIGFSSVQKNKGNK